jgi:hypothetical protein
MINKRFFIVVFSLLLFGCESGFDKSLISDTEKLISPGGKYVLYRYHIDSPMAFGSGFTVINIIKRDEECDFTDRDILRFQNDNPFWVKWKDNKTLAVKCLLDGGRLSKHQPIKKEIIKWKDWTFEVEYYSMFSSGRGTSSVFESCSANGNEIEFKTQNDSLVFNKDEVQFSLDGNRVYVREFKMDFFDNKLGLSFSNHELTAKGSYHQKIFQHEQPFIRVKP